MGSTLQHFVADTFETRRGKAQPGAAAAFEVVNGRRFLKVSLGGIGTGTGTGLTPRVWVKASCLVANRGGVILERDADAPGSDLMSASSATGAHLFLSSERCHVILLRLGRPGPGNISDALFVNMTALLAFEPTVNHTVNRVTVNRGGGLAATKAPTVNVVFLQGFGYVALLAQGPPMSVAIDPGLPPLCTNPQATIAWSFNVVFPHLAPKPGFLDSPDDTMKVVFVSLPLCFGFVCACHWCLPCRISI